MTERRRFAAIAFIALALSLPASGHAELTAEERRNRFQLFTECRPLALDVMVADSDGADTGYRRDTVQAAAESRLRSARLYDAAAVHSLDIQVLLLGRFVETTVKLEKFVYDSMSKEWGVVPTWQVGTIGGHGSDWAEILTDVSRHLDQFMVGYLRANEDACE